METLRKIKFRLLEKQFPGLLQGSIEDLMTLADETRALADLCGVHDPAYEHLSGSASAFYRGAFLRKADELNVDPELENLLDKFSKSFGAAVFGVNARTALDKAVEWDMLRANYTREQYGHGNVRVAVRCISKSQVCMNTINPD
jgi:hypothetical protein